MPIKNSFATSAQRKDSGRELTLAYLLAVRKLGAGAAEAQRMLARGILDQDSAPLRRVFSAVEPSAVEWARRALRESERLGLSIVHLGEESYPPRLAQASEPPLLLFAQGPCALNELIDRAALVVAIVGSRRCSSYGRRVARKIARELTQRGVLVVSGLAVGIDSSAHEGALDAAAEIPETLSAGIAVLGSGHLHLHPQRNGTLADRISRNSGLVLSEYEPQLRPSKFSFPARNRIIAGLSDAVIVVEAALRSGAAITARLAAEYGRDVWAVPGAIDSAQSEGSNQLLCDGANVFCTTERLMAHYGLGEWNSNRADAADLDGESLERDLLTHLESGEPCCLDELALATGADADRLRAALGLLEEKGLVASAAGGLYRRPQ